MASRPPVTGARHAPCGNRPVPQETVITHRMRVGIFLAPFYKSGIDVEEMLSFVNDSGFGAIGTPERANALIDRHVFPRWQGHRDSTLEASGRARAARPELADIRSHAVEAVTLRFRQEAARRGG